MEGISLFFASAILKGSQTFWKPAPTDFKWRCLSSTYFVVVIIGLTSNKWFFYFKLVSVYFYFLIKVLFFTSLQLTLAGDCFLGDTFITLYFCKIFCLGERKIYLKSKSFDLVGFWGLKRSGLPRGHLLSKKADR